jgi:hypothetical protein
MRFMLFIHPNITPEQYAEGVSAEDAAAMNTFNEALTKAGVLLALDGLHPLSEGARITVKGGQKSVTDGPYAEAKELVGGYWLIDVKSKEEAVEWATRVPLGEGDMIEVRRVFELSDFPQDVQDAAQLSQEPPAQTTAREG